MRRTCTKGLRTQHWRARELEGLACGPLRSFGTNGRITMTASADGAQGSNGHHFAFGNCSNILGFERHD